jgi:hypothetical protein
MAFIRPRPIESGSVQTSGKKINKGEEQNVVIGAVTAYQ